MARRRGRAAAGQGGGEKSSRRGVGRDRANREAGRAGAGGRSRSADRRRPAARSSGADRRPSDTGLGGDQVEGRNAVRELLAAGRRRVSEVWVAEDLDESPVIAEIIDLARERRVRLEHVSRSRLERQAASESPQGVLAMAARIRPTELDELISTSDGVPFLLVLDGITDPGNMGALLRSAEVAGVSGVVLPRHRSARLSPTVTKAAAGAVEHLRFAQVGGIPAALSQMKERGVWTVGLDADAGTSLFDLSVADEPVALVLGSEGEGLARLTRQRCDQLVAIPQRGALDSLNVSVAGGIALYEVVRRR